MLLVDFSPISIASAFACGEDLSEDLYRHLTLSTILSLRTKFKKYGETIIVFDSKNYWRKDIHPNYKGQRAAAREKSAFDFNKFYEYQETVKAEFASVFPYRWLQIPRLEADDIIGHLALTAKEQTVIVSPDGDFKQCMRNPRVKLWSNLKKKFEEDQTLIEIEFDLHKKIMKGDGGDNIPNVFTPLEGKEGRQKPVSQRLLEHTFENGVGIDLKTRYQENKTLIDLRYIPEEYKVLIEESLNSDIVGSKARIWNYLTSKKLNRIGSFIKDVESFA